jgi:hypothetical protein
MLLRAEAEGLKRGDIARLLGTTVNAVIGRLHRLRKIANEPLDAPQAQKRAAVTKALSDLENKLATGLDTTHAALRAYRAGASWPDILRHISVRK